MARACRACLLSADCVSTAQAALSKPYCCSRRPQVMHGSTEFIGFHAAGWLTGCPTCRPLRARMRPPGPRASHRTAACWCTWAPNPGGSLCSPVGHHGLHPWVQCLGVQQCTRCTIPCPCPLCLTWTHGLPRPDAALRTGVPYAGHAIPHHFVYAPPFLHKYSWRLTAGASLHATFSARHHAQPYKGCRHAMPVENKHLLLCCRHVMPCTGTPCKHDHRSQVHGGPRSPLQASCVAPTRGAGRTRAREQVRHACRIGCDAQHRQSSVRQ